MRLDDGRFKEEMKTQAFIDSSDKETVVLRALFTGADGTIGDAIFDVHPGDEFEGYTFAELTAIAAARGVVAIPKRPDGSS